MIFGFLARRGRKGKYLLLASGGVVAGAWSKGVGVARGAADARGERPAFEGAGPVGSRGSALGARGRV